MLSPELLPTYEALYKVVTALIIFIGVVSLFILMIAYLPSQKALNKLEEENLTLRIKLTEMANYAAVTNLEKNYLASEVGRLISEERRKGNAKAKHATARAEVFAQFGDKCRRELMKKEEVA